MTCTRHEKCMQNVCLKPEGKRLLGRHRHIWEDNIKTNIKVLGQEFVVWVCLAQDRDWCWGNVNMVISSVNGSEFFDLLSDCQFLLLLHEVD